MKTSQNKAHVLLITLVTLICLENCMSMLGEYKRSSSELSRYEFLWQNKQSINATLFLFFFLQATKVA